MPTVLKMLAVVAKLAKVLLKLINQFIQKHHQNQALILIIRTNIMKTIFLEIYQLQWTLRIKTMMNDQWIQIADQASDTIPTLLDE